MDDSNLTSKTSKKGIFAWCLYDWANSAFPTIVTTFIFAAYFTSAVAENQTIGTAQWGYTMTISGIFIAIFSPIFGALSDYYGRRKPWLMAFTFIAVLASLALWWVEPNTDSVRWALTSVIIGTVGFEIAAVFYNSMLHDIVPENYYGRVSGWGWGLGYIGGLACLIVALLFVNMPDTFHLNTKAAEHVRISGPLVAIWFLIFSIPMLLFTPDLPKQMSLKQAVKKGLSQFISSLKHIARHEKNVLYFLIAHMIYIDGLNTIFAFGGIYAAGTFGFTTKDIILFGIFMNVGAGFGAITLAWFDDWFGSKNVILFCIAGLMITGTGILLVTDITAFWTFGLMSSLFFGPIQASSRSLLAHIAPENMVTEAFGLFAFSGRATAFLGPWIFGLATLHFESQRAGMATTMLFLLTGVSLLFIIKPKR